MVISSKHGLKSGQQAVSEMELNGLSKELRPFDKDKKGKPLVRGKEPFKYGLATNVLICQLYET
jgi:hypothetical protein